MALFAFFQGCERSERAFQAIGAGNPNLIEWLNLAGGDEEKDEKTSVISFPQLHLVEQVQKTPSLPYLVEYLTKYSPVREQGDVAPWLVDFDHPLSQGTIGRVFPAKSKDPTDEKGYALKSSKIKDHLVSNALGEIVLTCLCGERSICPPLFDAWTSTEGFGVARWRDILHQKGLGVYFCMVTEKLPDGILPLEKWFSFNPSADELIAVAADVFKRIADMHALHIVHRRLKLYNVVVLQTPVTLARAWILNFGEATISKEALTKEQRDEDAREIIEAFETALKGKGRDHDWQVSKESYP